MNKSIWIVAALHDEVRDLLKIFEPDYTLHLHPALLWQGDWKGRTLTFLVTGVGGKRMTEGLTKALATGRPDQILHVGYAGGATPLVSAGKLIAADAIVEESNAKEYRADAALLQLIQSLSDKSGRLLTVSKVIEDPLEKAALGTEHDCVAIDMESSSCAAFCEAQKIPWVVARAVFDSFDTPLPNLPTRHERGEPQIIDVLLQLLRNPKMVTQIPHLNYCASQARQRLTQFVTDFLKL